MPLHPLVKNLIAVIHHPDNWSDDDVPRVAALLNEIRRSEDAEVRRSLEQGFHESPNDPNVAPKIAAAKAEGHDYPYDMPVLNYALQRGSGPNALPNALPIAEFIITKTRINLDTYDQNGVTPLMIAATLDYPEMVELLLKHGANLALKAHNSSADGTSQGTAIEFAQKHGNREVLTTIKAHTDAVIQERQHDEGNPVLLQETQANTQKNAGATSSSSSGVESLNTQAYGKADRNDKKGKKVGFGTSPGNKDKGSTPGCNLQ